MSDIENTENIETTDIEEQLLDQTENTEGTDTDISTDNTDTEEQLPEQTIEEKRKYKILRNAYMKLDSLPLSFGIPSYDDEIPDEVVEKYFRVDLADTLRETRLNIEDIEDNSIDEMYFENRIVYHALRRFRLTASVFFKFSTAVDGKTIDKTQIPKMLATIISEYDAEYKQWRLGSIGKLWNRTVN